jgi:hypothetical protein
MNDPRAGCGNLGSAQQRAGAPLITGTGHALGSVWVIDSQPRMLLPAQMAALSALARSVMGHLETRRVAARLADALAEVRTERQILPICSHCKAVRDDEGYWHQVSVARQRESEPWDLPAVRRGEFPGAVRQDHGRGQAR